MAEGTGFHITLAQRLAASEPATPMRELKREYGARSQQQRDLADGRDGSDGMQSSRRVGILHDTVKTSIRSDSDKIRIRQPGRETLRCLERFVARCAENKFRSESLETFAA
jgi:hypothetical protein